MNRRLRQAWEHDRIRYLDEDTRLPWVGVLRIAVGIGLGYGLMVWITSI